MKRLWHSLAVAVFASFVLAQAPETVAEGLNSPQGVTVGPGGELWVIDAGTGGEEEITAFFPTAGGEVTARYGDTARVVRVAPDGEQTVVATLPSLLVGQEATGGARLAFVDGVLYATNGFWVGTAGAEAPDRMAVVLRVGEDEVTEVADTWRFELEQNPAGFVEESHPYGLTAGPGGELWVADAGANTLLKIDADGALSLVATFAGLPAPMPNPARGGAEETDPVPTAVVLGDDGGAYVSFLSGFPFTPGSAKVVRVSPEGEVSDYATDLTMLTDLRRGPDGNLYAVKFAEWGEGGPTPNTGAIYRVSEGAASEVVVDGLSFPTSVDFNLDGDAYVAVNGAGAPGSGAVVRFGGLAAR